MNSDSPISLLPIAYQAMDLAREIFLTRAPGRLTPKGDRDMASETDFAIERAVAAFLGEATPAIGFLGEEEGHWDARTGLTWALDPVDGTVNFVHGSPLCAISLAVINDDEPVLGVVDLPLLGRRYAAVKNRGAHCDRRPIFTSRVRALQDAVIAIGDYSVGAGAGAKNRDRLAVTGQLAETVQRVRMHGSTAVELAWLAEGKVDGVVILSNRPWDTAAGTVIAREAGATVVDVDGTAHSTAAGATIAANPSLLPLLRAVVADAVRGAG